MKKIYLLILLFIPLLSCKKSINEPKNQFECFEQFQKAASEGDFETVKLLTQSQVDDPLTTLTKFKKPFLELITEDQRGAYGVKIKDGITLFFVKLRDDDFMVKDTFIVGVMNQPEIGYRVSHFSKPTK